jgi:hypothetical protein
MKKILALVFALVLLAPGQIVAAETALPVGDIGRALKTLVSENPGFEYGFVSWLGFAWTTYGQPTEGGAYRAGDFGYVFFGTQYAELEAVASKYSDKLRCAGIASTVGTLFPDTRKGVKAGEFLSALGIKNYKKYDGEPDSPAEDASLFFKHNGLDVYIIFPGVTKLSVDTTTIGAAYPAVIIDSGIDESNRKICDDFYNAQ